MPSYKGLSSSVKHHLYLTEERTGVPWGCFLAEHELWSWTKPGFRFRPPKTDFRQVTRLSLLLHKMGT